MGGQRWGDLGRNLDAPENDPAGPTGLWYVWQVGPLDGEGPLPDGKYELPSPDHVSSASRVLGAMFEGNALTLDIDQDSGSLVFENTSDVSYTLESYSVTAGGSLIPEGHDGLSDGGFGTNKAESTTEFSDDDNGEGGITLEPGDTLTLSAGDAWSRGPEHLQDAGIEITVADGRRSHSPHPLYGRRSNVR